MRLAFAARVPSVNWYLLSLLICILLSEPAEAQWMRRREVRSNYRPPTTAGRTSQWGSGSMPRDATAPASISGELHEIVTWKRAQNGLQAGVWDEECARRARLCVEAQANANARNHHVSCFALPGGSNAEGVGWYSGADPGGLHLCSCCLYDRNLGQYGYAIKSVPGRGTFYAMIRR